MAGDIFFIIAIIWISLAFGTAFDASNRGGNAVVWFIIVAFTGIFGLFAYLIANMVRTQTSDTKTVVKVSGQVVDEQGKETKVVLPVQTENIERAVERFKAKCMDEGYRIKNEPRVELDQ